MPEYRLLRLLAPHLPRIALAALGSAAAQLSGIALIATATWLLASAAFQPPLASLTVAIVAVRTFALSRGGLRYLDRLIGHDAVLRAMARLRGTLFEALTPLAPTGSNAFRSGDLLSRLICDIDAVQDLILRIWTPLCTAFVVCIVATGFMALYSVPAALIFLAGAVLLALVLPAVSGKLAASNPDDIATRRGNFAAASTDLFVGAEDLAAYGATKNARARAMTQAQAVAAIERRSAAISAAITATATIITAATVIGVFAVAADLGIMTAVLALLTLVTCEAVAELPAAAQLRVDVRASITRVVEILDCAVPVADPPQPQKFPAGDCHLRLHNVRPNIPGAVETESAAAGVDLDLPMGHRVAILGPSGAGKTMLLNVLVRFTTIATGRVTIGGVDIDRAAGDEVRQLVGGMLSPAHLFNMTVRENLRIAAPSTDDDKLRSSLDRIGLSELELETSVGRDGERLSGGQRQRLLLAQAVLAEHPILLLDEPTEHLDDASANAVTADMLDATAGRSLIAVTHRLAGLEAFDEILFIENGSVVQRGTHASLVDRAGPYRELYLSQVDARQVLA